MGPAHKGTNFSPMVRGGGAILFFFSRVDPYGKETLIRVS